MWLGARGTKSIKDEKLKTYHVTASLAMMPLKSSISSLFPVSTFGLKMRG